MKKLSHQLVNQVEYWGHIESTTYMTFCFCSLQWSTFPWTECRSGYCVSVYTNDFISLEIFINNLPYCSPTNWNDFFSFGSWNLGQLECLHVQLTVLRNCVWFFFFFFCSIVGYTLCHQQLAMPGVTDIWKIALQDGYCVTLFRDEVIMYHKEFQNLLDGMKGWDK